MICALCKEREANKKNTHYLTDGIIRLCLNLDGSSEREKGFYFDMSDKTRVRFNFQRSTDIEKLESTLGRPATDEEIEKAKQNPYSVDDVFCDQCESIFAEIETEFMETVLPTLRSVDLSAQHTARLTNVKLIRLFFYLQIWRSAVCVDKLRVSLEIKEKLRNFILNYKTVTSKELSVYPLSITYLETLGGNNSFTSNYVGFINSQDPFIVLMNDFVVQFYHSFDTINFQELSGLNSADYEDYINHEEIEFRIKILNDNKRKTFLNTYRQKDADERIHHYVKSFSKLWFEIFHQVPSNEIIHKYIGELTKNSDESVLNYTKETITHITAEFILKETGNR